MTHQRSTAVLAAITVLVAVTGTTSAHGLIPRDVPVDRLVANLTKYTKEQPNDPEGYYRLGRVHTLALETKTGFVLAFNDLRPAEGAWARRQAQEPGKETPEQIRAHLAEAVRNLNKAIQMHPTEPRYRLTLACALEAGNSMIADVDAWPLKPRPGAAEMSIDSGGEGTHVWLEFERALTDTSVVPRLIEGMREEEWATSRRRDAVMTVAYEFRDRKEYKEIVQRLRKADWQEQIEEQFFTAMCMGLPNNGKATEKPIWGGMENWTSYEAGKNFIRVVKAREPRPEDAIRLKVAHATIQAFDDLPRPSAITPIVVGLHHSSLADARSSAVSAFDLDGSARLQRWTWVKPDAGILVWDPERTGRITSGRQLFGSVSWWVFFDNGYQALDALDDNRDGELAGYELNGISVWFDRNSNGVSDFGEVTPAYQLDIAALSCRATHYEGVAPVNPTGMRLRDGRVYPTFDWVATPVSEPRTLTLSAGAIGVLVGATRLRRKLQP